MWNLPSWSVVIASLSSLYSLSPMSLVAFTLNWYEVKGFSLKDEVGKSTAALVRNYWILNRNINVVSLLKMFLTGLYDYLSSDSTTETFTQG